MTKNNLQDVVKKLESLNEKELRHILVQMFRELEFQEVIENHGSQEYGKDIVFYETTKLGKVVWHACVVKAIQINQSGLNDVTRQVNECYKKKYPSHNHGNVRISQVHVLTNQTFKDNTKNLIAEEIDDEKNRAQLTYWDVSDIANVLLHKTPHTKQHLFLTEDVVKYTYDTYVHSILADDSSIKLFAREFDTKFTSIEEFQIDVKAQSKEHEEERDVYLKPLTTKIKKIPVRLFPEIDEIMGSPKNFLVHGIATSGKTTILKKLGKDFLRSYASGLVFFLELNKYATKIHDRGILSVCEELYEFITRNTVSLVKIGKDSKVLILIDGLDEIQDQILQEAVIDQIHSISTVRGIKLVCSARTSDWLMANDRLKSLLEYYELLPLTLSEMMKIGSKFLDDQQYRDFTRLIKRSQIAQAFPKTPLTTILLAILMKEDKLNTKDLPKNITELYSKITDIFLNKWDKEKGVSEQYQHQVRLFVLQKLARQMHQDGKLLIDQFELMAYLNQLSENHPLESIGDINIFVDNISQRSNLITRNEKDGTFSFFHPTIQEYLLSSILDVQDENQLVRAFYDNWWLNANIFYAGRTPFKSNVLERISELKENYPASVDDKLAYVIHTTKVLQAAHLIDRTKRMAILSSVVKVFDEMVKDTLHDLPHETDKRIRRRTMLDWILHFRRLFMEFLGSSQFKESLLAIHEVSFATADSGYTDIVEYSLSYELSSKQRDSRFLETFLKSRPTANPRWYQIVAVDLDVLDLKPTTKNYPAQLKAKIKRHHDYIRDQFQDRMEKHYKSITGIS